MKGENKISTSDQIFRREELLLLLLTFLLFFISSLMMFRGSLNIAAVGLVIPGLSGLSPSLRLTVDYLLLCAFILML